MPAKRKAPSAPALHVVRLVTDRRQADRFDDLFDLMGIDTVSWRETGEDKALFEIFCESPEQATDWRERLKKIAADEALGPWKLEVGELADQDWSVSWQQFFHTEKISEHLVVRPSWETYEPAAGEQVIVLDPGMSFGTGSHFTTRSCLMLIDRLSAHAAGGTLCDAGCGSGILSIAAAKLGFRDIVAFDNNPTAVGIASANLDANGVADAVTCFEVDVEGFETDQGFDVVAANLYSDILIEHADAIAALVADSPEGFLILSGILAPQFEAVREAYLQQGFRLAQALTDGEWQTGLFVLGSVT